MSQNNHLARVWMSDSFIEPGRSIEELKSKDRIERERQWGSERNFKLAKDLQEWSASRKGYVILFFSQGRVRWSPCELTKDTLTVRQRGRVLWGKPLCMTVIIKAIRSKSKKQFQHVVRTGFSLQHLEIRREEATLDWRNWRWFQNQKIDLSILELWLKSYRP